MKTITKSIYLGLASIALVCVSPSPTAQAVVPPPDGCYPNFTTAEGCKALQNLVGGSANTGLGWYALFSDVQGSFNTAIGGGALTLNTADSNTAVGAAAGLLNTIGNMNVAVGTAAMVSNDADDNTGVGAFALNSNVSGVTNAALGVFAAENTTSDFNVALGGFALRGNVAGNRNTAVGAGAMESGAAGDDNTAVGEIAGNNITGSGNSCFGSSAGSHIVGATNGVVIGNGSAGNGTGLVAAPNVISIGNVTGASSVFGDVHDSCYIGSIYNQNIGGAGTPHAVWVDADGTLGLMPSSRRFKHDIKPMDQASAALLALKPVTFKYNSDKKGTQQFGLIAEEVAEVNPDLILRDDQGTILSVRYEQVNAMLLNEFLKEHKKVERLQATVAQQEKGFEARLWKQQKQIEALTAGLQKVSAQLELNKPAQQTVQNRQ